MYDDAVVVLADHIVCFSLSYYVEALNELGIDC